MSMLEARRRHAGPTGEGAEALPSAPRPPLSASTARPAHGLSRLRAGLIVADLVVASVAWGLWSTLAQVRPGGWAAGPLRIMALAVVLTMASLAALHLYRARINGVRAVEIVGLARATAATAVLLQASKGAIGVTVGVPELAAGAAGTFLALLLERRAFRAWLGSRRRRGEHLRPVVVVGTDDEGRALVATLRRNPDAGYRVVGLVGDPHGVANTGAVPWLGPTCDTAEIVRERGVTGAFLAASALTPSELNRTTRALMADGRHVHLSNSLRGIAARRIRLQPISRDMMYYLEPAQLRRWEEQVKRVIDVTLACVGLVVTAPVLVVAAIGIKLSDGGPALFRQERVGRDGAPFTLLKLRTMVLDAELLLPGLRDRNERDGVLFKVEDDPRVTRLGRVLRAASLDELPQLLNVLRGEMSLVGPRPALPAEVARFDARLRARQQVTPGVTGLWQVEAREVSDLGAYTRLDLFYVENWSVSLDLAIILSTITHVAGRAVRLLHRKVS